MKKVLRLSSLLLVLVALLGLTACAPKDPAKAKEILKALGLEKAEKKPPYELPGGIKLRASIARSLYFGGNIFLWDEPTKELDPENAKNIIEIIKSLSEKHLVIVVTHDQNLNSENVIKL